MAKVVTETVTVEISRLVKGNKDVASLITDELVSTVEAVVQELVGDSAVVEVSREE
jgi:hypothetical protein